MANRVQRRPDEGAEGAGSLAGSSGPYMKTDRTEFHHASPEAREWFLRLDPEEVVLLRVAARFHYSAQLAVKWAKRLFWAFTGGLAAALTAGENLQKLPGMISGILSTLKGLFGL